MLKIGIEMYDRIKYITYLSMYCTSIMYAMQAASSPSKCTVGFNTVVLMPRFLPKTVKTDSIHNLVNYVLVKNLNFIKKKI